ncbi:hypothetical protein EV363DRAFT_1182316, partial [Boletus edulis]
SPRPYFGRSEVSIAEDESQEEVRVASLSEVMDTASKEWQRYWQTTRSCRCPLKGRFSSA